MSGVDAVSGKRADMEALLEKNFKVIEQNHKCKPENGEQFNKFKEFAEALNEISKISAELGASNADLIQKLDQCFEAESHEIQSQMAKSIGKEDCFRDFGFQAVYERLKPEYEDLVNELDRLLLHEEPRPEWVNFAAFAAVAVVAFASWLVLN